MSRLTSNSSVAERTAGCVFAETFRSKEAIVENNASVVNISHLDPKGTVTLNGTTDYIKYDLRGDEFNSSEISIVFEFWPGFEADDDINHYLFDSSSGSRHIVYKDSYNRLIFYLGNTSVGYTALASFQDYWIVGERNILVVSGTSGNNKLWLNGHLIISTTTTWTVKQPVQFFMGATYANTALFKGKIGQVKVFKSLLTEQDALNYYNRSCLPENKIIDLPMRMIDHDVANLRTTDISGNNNHGIFGDGSTPSTYPVKISKIGYLNKSTTSFRIPLTLSTPKISISILIELDQNTAIGSYLFDCRFNSGVGYAWILPSGLIEGYNIVSYIDGSLGNNCSKGLHALTLICSGHNIAEQLIIGARFNYNPLSSFLSNIKSFQLHTRELTQLEISNIHTSLLRKANNV